MNIFPVIVVLVVGAVVAVVAKGFLLKCSIHKSTLKQIHLVEDPKPQVDSATWSPRRGTERDVAWLAIAYSNRFI